MTVQIQEFNIARLTMETCFDFLDNVSEEFTKLTYTEIVAKSQAFQDSVIAFDEALKQESLKPFTQKIEEARKDNAAIFTALNEALQAGLKHFDADIQKAAQDISYIFSLYGNPNTMPDAERLGTLKNMVQDLKSDKYKTQIKKAWLEAYVPKLDETTIALDHAIDERDQAQKKQVKGITADSRKNAESAYREIIHIVNATLTLHPTDELIGFAEMINQKIDKRKTSAAISKGLKKKDDKAIDGEIVTSETV